MTFTHGMMILIMSRAQAASEAGWRVRWYKNAPSRNRFLFVHPPTGAYVNLRGGTAEVVFAEALGRLPANPQPPRS